MSWLNTVSPLASGVLAVGQSRSPVSAMSLGLRGSVISMMSTSVWPCSSSSEATRTWTVSRGEPSDPERPAEGVVQKG
jgi:hypothetical protein